MNQDNELTSKGHKQASQISLQMLPLIMNNIPQAVFWKDHSLVYLGCNQAFAEDAGLSSPEEIVGKTDFELPWKAQAELYRADDRRVLESGEAKLNYEEPQTSPTGSTIWLRTSKIPVHEDGKVVAILGMYEDVTEHKQVELDLLLRDRALASSLNAVIILNFSDNKPIYANEALLKMTGYSFDEIKQLTLLDIIDNPEEFAKIRSTVQSQGFFVGEESVKRKDRSSFPATFFTSLIRDGQGQPIAIQSSFFDITERKEAEENILESEERFRRFTEATTEGVVFHEGGVIIDTNPSVVAMFGVSSNTEVIGKNLLQFIKPEFHELVITQMQLDAVAPYEVTCVRKDGSVFPVETSTRRYKYEDRDIRATSVRDITQRKQAEAAIRDSEEKLRAIYESSNDAIMLLTEKGFFDCNSQTLKMFGYRTKEEFISTHPSDVSPAKQPNGQDSVLASQEHIQSAYRQGYDRFEWVHRRSNGEDFPAEVLLSAFEFGGQRVLQATVRDITERKQIEGRLNESEERYRQLSDATVEGIVIHDNGILLDASAVFARMFGYSISEVLGMPATAFLTPETREITTQNIRSGSEKPYEVMGLRKDGSTFPVEITGKTVHYQGRMVRAAALRDISERKQLEKQVRESFERRGYQVQISTEISQEIAAVTDLNELFERIVTLTKERLGYYHTQLLRYDPVKDAVVLIVGYGETGQKMLAGGHSMPLGRGLIGGAAETGETIMRPNLADDPDWQPNPLLPETKGEIAIPIKFGEQILGVLDVQSAHAGALAEDDRLMLEGLCGQVAIAMHNAELVETVRQNEARLAEALKAARLANWEYDVENDIFTFNDQFYAIFQTTAEKAGGYQLSSARYAELFVHPDDMPLVGIEIGKALNSTERVYNATLEHRIIYADGKVGHISVRLTVERDENGKITRYFGANQDITERKQAEEALRENEQRYQQILDAITDMVLVKAEKSRIVWANKAFRDYYGMTNEQLRDMIDAPFAEPDYTLQYVKDDAFVFENGEILHIPEEPVARHDGVVRKFETVKAPIRDINGKVVMTVGVSRDITERIKEQESMAERLAEINRLYSVMSREGWKTYRQTADLPAGFLFDQDEIRPVADDAGAGEQYASIPVKVLGGELVATLDVADDPEHPISSEERAFLQQASEQIALALESARLFDQTQSALAQSEQLFRASNLLTQVADFQGLVRVVAETMNIPVVNRTVLNLFNYNTAGELESMDVAATWWSGTGREPTPIGTHYSTEAVRAMPFFISQTPVFSSDVFSDERIDASSLQVAKSINLRSGAILPLHAGSRQIGILFMQAEEPHVFTQEETRLFEALAPQIATVLENRRQFERAQKQAEREAMLNTINQKIQSATSVEAVLQIAARELGHALGAPRTIAQLSMKDKN